MPVDLTVPPSSALRISAIALVRSVHPWRKSVSLAILWPLTISLVLMMLTTSGAAAASFAAPLPGVWISASAVTTTCATAFRSFATFTTEPATAFAFEPKSGAMSGSNPVSIATPRAKKVPSFAKNEMVVLPSYETYPDSRATLSQNRWVFPRNIRWHRALLRPRLTRCGYCQRF